MHDPQFWCLTLVSIVMLIAMGILVDSNGKLRERADRAEEQLRQIKKVLQ